MSKTTLELFLTVKHQFYYLKRYFVKSITNDMLLKLYNNLFKSVCICRRRRVPVLHLKVSTTSRLGLLFHLTRNCSKVIFLVSVFSCLTIRCHPHSMACFNSIRGRNPYSTTELEYPVVTATR